MQSVAVAALRPVTETHVSEEEFARLTGKSALTLKRWRRVGYGPKVIRIGRTPYYCKSAVAEFLSTSINQCNQA